MATIVKGKNARKPHTVRFQDQGKQRERSFATAGEAKDFIAKFEHDSRSSIFIDPKLSKVDFVTYAAAWIAGLDRAPSTRKAYRSVLNAQITPAFAGRTLAQVAADREGVWSLVSGLDLSASRRTTVMRVITGPCDEAVRAGRIPAHKLGGLKIRKDAQTAAQIIPATKEQLEKLADGLKPELDLVVWLMRGCGLRVSEALAVNIAGFRDNGKVLRVHEQVSDGGTLGPLKHRRTGEFRDVPVPSWLWAKVQAHVEEFGTDGGYLFGSNGKRVTYKASHLRFTRAADNAGLDGMTEHNLRHLYVSTLLANGVPITDVAQWVGHRDINVTHAVYGHLLPDSWTRGRAALETI